MVAWLDVLREVYPETPEELETTWAPLSKPALWRLCGRCGHRCVTTAIFCINCGAGLGGPERMERELASMRRRRFSKRPGMSR